VQIEIYKVFGRKNKLKFVAKYSIQIGKSVTTFRFSTQKTKSNIFHKYLEVIVSVQDQYDSQKKKKYLSAKGASAFMCETRTTGD